MTDRSTARSRTIAEDYESLRTGAAARLLDRDVMRVSGVDASSYLQGQCSQDVSAMSAGQTAGALLLSPQGRVEVLIRVTRLADDAFLIDTDAGFGTVAVARLERFRLRAKVGIEPLPWVCIGVRGPATPSDIGGQAHSGGGETGAGAGAGAGAGGEGQAPAVPPVVPLALPVDWAGMSGLDVIGPEPAEGAFSWVGDGVPRCGEEAWEAVRIETGIPVNGREIVEGTIAAEVGLVDRTVSLTKGCFTGQELVARLDARGSKVARRLCGVVTEDDVPVGAEVYTADGEHEVGHLSSVAWSPGLQSTVALATLHRRVTPPESVSIRWDERTGSREAEGEARPLPLDA